MGKLSFSQSLERSTYMQYIVTPEMDFLPLSCTVVGVFDNQQLTPAGLILDQISQGYLTKAIQQNNFTGKIKRSLILYQVPQLQTQWVLLVGCGNAGELSASQFRQLIRHAYDQLNSCGATTALFTISELTLQHPCNNDLASKIRQIVICLEDANYQFNPLKTKTKTPVPALTDIFLHMPSANSQTRCEEAIQQASAIAHGMKLTKDLANFPANICTPTYLAEQSRLLAQQLPSLTTHILDEDDMAKLGMHSLLSVSKGSNEPAKLITLHYHGAATTSDAPYVLVGKGITFDSGGISLKPGAGMDEMKFDMAGAASVIGTLHAVAELKLPINVIGVIAAAENLPGSKATRPGDIVTSMSGLTIEILNTDAEGRLVLCDALTYVQKFQPKTVIDIATLTGAIIIALGHQISGLMSNNDALVSELTQASKDIEDSLCYLPLPPEYHQTLESNFADMANISCDRAAGSIIAGCFLAKFTKDYHWAHLDIAGTAWKSGKEKGATGRPVALLTQYLINESMKKHEK